VTPEAPSNRLDGLVDEAFSRVAHEGSAKMHNRFGNRMHYVFRHRPLAGNDIARGAAELVESCSDPVRFSKQIT